MPNFAKLFIRPSNKVEHNSSGAPSLTPLELQAPAARSQPFCVGSVVCGLGPHTTLPTQNEASHRRWGEVLKSYRRAIQCLQPVIFTLFVDGVHWEERVGKGASTYAKGPSFLSQGIRLVLTSGKSLCRWRRIRYLTDSGLSAGLIKEAYK